MKQRESSSRGKSWIFVWLVNGAEVWFSQWLAAFPLNRDPGMVEKAASRKAFSVVAVLIFSCFYFFIFFSCIFVRVETELTMMPVSNCNCGLNGFTGYECSIFYYTKRFCPEDH